MCVYCSRQTRRLSRHHWLLSPPAVDHVAVGSDHLVLLADGTALDLRWMELQIQAAFPDISHAFVVGGKYPSPALLVVLSHRRRRLLHTTDDWSALMEELWLIVQEANLQVTPRARKDKRLILPIASIQPAMLAGHESTLRSSVVRLYAQEIDHLYRNLGLEFQRADADRSSSILSVNQITQLVRQRMAQIWPDGQTIEDNANLFASGFDTLHALRLARTLRQEMNLFVVTVQTVHDNPSIAQLGHSLYTFQGRCPEILQTNQRLHAQQIKSMLDEYTAMINQITPSTCPQSHDRPDPAIVIVGSAGPLAISQISGLWRKVKYRIHYLASQPVPSIHDSLVTVYPCDPSQIRFGLSLAEYATLTRDVRLIINNLWSWDAVLDLPHFRPSLNGLVNTFQLAIDSGNGPEVFDLSSADAVACSPAYRSHWLGNKIHTPASPLPTGFAVTRFVAEHMCALAASTLKLRVVIRRVRQLVRPVEKDPWEGEGWLRGLVLASLQVGCLPGSLGNRYRLIDWVSKDDLPGIILYATLFVDRAWGLPPSGDVAYLDESDRNPTTWTVLVRIIKRVAWDLGQKRLEIVPLDQWLDRFQFGVDAARRDKQLVDFLAADLADREAAARTVRDQLPTEADSRDTVAIKESWLRRWMAGWLQLHASSP